jgi:hypothetical protein
MTPFGASVLFVLLVLISVSIAAQIPAGYVSVGRREDVPPDILYAVACAESGRRMPDGRIYPWPWVLNVAGESRFFPTRAAAYQNLIAQLSDHANVDIGLGQINWRWHRDRLFTPWSALDPYFNLRTMARLLRHQFDRCACGDWWTAVERYHAPTDSEPAGHRRARYRDRVQQCWNRH